MSLICRILLNVTSFLERLTERMLIKAQTSPKNEIKSFSNQTKGTFNSSPDLVNVFYVNTTCCREKQNPEKYYCFLQNGRTFSL